jgi:hypothetical protein
MKKIEFIMFIISNNTMSTTNTNITTSGNGYTTLIYSSKPQNILNDSSSPAREYFLNNTKTKRFDEDCPISMEQPNQFSFVSV